MNIQFNAAVVNENDVYFSAKNFNGLFKWNINNEKAELIGHFPNDQLWTEYLHQFAIMNKNNIYYIPYMSGSITKFDMNSKEIVTIGKVGKGVSWGISHVLKYNFSYILVPRELKNPISVFYPDEEIFEFIDINLTENESVNSYSDIFCASIVDDTIFVPIYDTNKVIGIDLQSKNESIVVLEEIKVSAIQHYNDKLWLVSSSGDIVNRYNRKFELEKKYHFKGNTIRPYESWLQYNNHLYLCGCLDDSLIVYDEDNDIWTEVLPERNERVCDNWAYICGYQDVDDKLYLFPSSTCYMVVMDNGEISKYRVEYDNDDLQRTILRKKHDYYFGDCKNQIQYEGEHVSLGDLIDYLKTT